MRKVNHRSGFTPLEIWAVLKQLARSAPRSSCAPRKLPRSASLTGFTLIETIIATVLLLTAVVGSVSLITRGIFEFKFAKNKLIATSLAQEGVELVRAIRTNNVICDFLNGDAKNYKWDRVPGGPPGLSINSSDRSVAFNQTTTIDCDSGESLVTPMLTGSCTQLLKRDSLGRYQYSDASGDETPFSRCVDICTPPNPACGGAADGGIPPPEQMDIVSTVTWNEAGRDRSVTVRERLYNWR